MEIQGTDGSNHQINPNNQPTILGRGTGFPSTDLSISRRHISLHFNLQTPSTLSFEVLGKNPVWVFNNSQPEGEKIRSFRRFQRGQLGVHDLFCVSPKDPVWFGLKVVDEGNGSQRGGGGGCFGGELSQCLESDDFELGFVDVSCIDPVKEFGFLVIGHEFDQYPKHMIREIKNWDWFLDDPKKNSDDEEYEDSNKKGNKGGRRKRKKTSKGDNDEDEEWTAESEGEEQITSTRVQRLKYHTRSKDHGALQKGRVIKKSSAGTSKREEEEEDEDDETLGGFIVDENTTEEEVENEIDEDEEEEFMDDEDELED